MSEREFEFGPVDHDWITVFGPALPHPLRVKTRVVGRRLRIVGLTIDGGQPITSATLQRIPIGRLSTALGEHLRERIFDAAAYEGEIRLWLEARGFHNRLDVQPDIEERQWRQTTGQAGPGTFDDEINVARYVQHLASEREKLETLVRSDREDDDSDPTGSVPRGPGAKPATEQELREFALVFLEELEKGRGAVSRTATRRSMHRSTVNRWVRECQKRGLVPQEQE